MNKLCFATNLTSTELAAWVQAVGSIVAIIGVVLVAVWQASKQHRNALALHAAEQRYARIELAKTLAVLVQNCAKAMVYISGQIDGKLAVYAIAKSDVHLDLAEIARLDAAIDRIPLHGLSSSLVTPIMGLSATVRQFLENVKGVIGGHRSMDDSAFEEFSRIIGEMNESMRETCNDIAVEIERMQKIEVRA